MPPNYQPPANPSPLAGATGQALGFMKGVLSGAAAAVSNFVQPDTLPTDSEAALRRQLSDGLRAQQQRKNMTDGSAPGDVGDLGEPCCTVDAGLLCLLGALTAVSRRLDIY